MPALTTTLKHLVNIPQTHSYGRGAKCFLRTHCDNGGRHTFSQLTDLLQNVTGLRVFSTMPGTTVVVGASPSGST